MNSRAPCQPGGLSQASNPFPDRDAFVCNLRILAERDPLLTLSFCGSTVLDFKSKLKWKDKDSKVKGKRRWP